MVSQINFHFWNPDPVNFIPDPVFLVGNPDPFFLNPNLVNFIPETVSLVDQIQNQVLKSGSGLFWSFRSRSIFLSGTGQPQAGSDIFGQSDPDPVFYPDPVNPKPDPQLWSSVPLSLFLVGLISDAISVFWAADKPQIEEDPADTPQIEEDPADKPQIEEDPADMPQIEEDPAK